MKIDYFSIYIVIFGNLIKCDITIDCQACGYFTKNCMKSLKNTQELHFKNLQHIILNCSPKLLNNKVKLEQSNIHFVCEWGWSTGRSRNEPMGIWKKGHAWTTGYLKERVRINAPTNFETMTILKCKQQLCGLLTPCDNSNGGSLASFDPSRFTIVHFLFYYG